MLVLTVDAEGSRAILLSIECGAHGLRPRRARILRSRPQVRVLSFHRPSSGKSMVTTVQHSKGGSFRPERLGEKEPRLLELGVDVGW